MPMTPRGKIAPDDYRVGREAEFPCRTSLTWFIRTYKPELVDRGALLYIGGRKLIVEDLFDQAVADIGQRNARAVLGRSALPVGRLP